MISLTAFLYVNPNMYIEFIQLHHIFRMYYTQFTVTLLLSCQPRITSLKHVRYLLL